ncbi:50S ribosomal protein L16 arginine hydroxylase [Psychromonas sp. psych-6C06]|uniref:ribosomal protein uL16 3-hydroxylase n=1 Tax=Psychromonas sp. psych-6C06 TaxID=2058089 RepID=UPI000C348F20|nr:cupin domain-containing protein [Psychromonas sp. psych-6C06]PKF63280.1 50S ribosomal protein L16 arginine hydroxylase [Psychromonas sp. psych-6C06]
MFELNLEINHFLDTYWQKKPTVIKQGFTDFIDPILPDEIAGLAMEEEVESRLVYRDEKQQWQAECGPFESFEKLENDGATLLIQAVDNWHEEAQQLIRPFRFIPNWRIDDLMISYSTPKGGVGPHIDNYDVFIIQGLGKRHWRVGDNTQLSEFAAHGALKHCEAFEAIIDVELEPGDILYIPVGFPHEGYAVEPSMNYSVGFRAPDQNDLLSSFADHQIDSNENAERYTDRVMQQREKAGRVEEQELQELHRVMLANCATPKQLIPWIGKMLSDAKHDLDLAPPEPAHSKEEIIDELNNGAQFMRLGGLRALYFEQDSESIFINGEQYNVSNCSELGQLLCDQDEVAGELLNFLNDDEGGLALFTALVNKGYWYAL